jgi:hypothetical protein
MLNLRGAARRTTKQAARLGAIAATLSVVAFSALSATGTGAGAVTPTAPAAPTAPVATAGYQSVELSWTVGANNGDPVTSFILGGYLSGALVSAVSLPVGAVGSDLDPTPGAHDFFVIAGTHTVTAFSFTISAVNAVGVGAASAMSNVVTSTASPVAPFAPYNVTATAAAGGATVKWSVPTNNGSAITGFTITPFIGASAQTATTVAAGVAGSALSPTPNGVDTDTITGLTAGTTYTFTVSATNGVGTSPASASSNAVAALAPAKATLTASVSTLNFGDMTLGDITDDQTITFTNTGNVPAVITNFDLEGVGANDYVETSDTECDDPTTVAPGASCVETLAFLPGALGSRPATLSPIDGASGNPVVSLNGTGSEGYYEVTASGHVDTFGDAIFQGDLTGQALPAPIVSIVSTGDNGGYWLFDAYGDVYTFGDAGDFGDTGNVDLNKPIVGMAPTPDDGGYWLVASDGGIFSFGDASFFGSTGALRLNRPIVGMATTPDGGGYWLVASDGGIFAFGDAPFYGSTGSLRLNKPIVGMATTPDGGGYWLVASDGGIFAFGDAPFFGSTGALKLVKPIVGMAATPDGGGYWLDASDGGIFAFGDAPFYGSDGGKGITNSAGIAIDGYPTSQASFDVPAARTAAVRTKAARVKTHIQHYRR